MKNPHQEISINYYQPTKAYPELEEQQVIEDNYGKNNVEISHHHEPKHHQNQVDVENHHHSNSCPLVGTNVKCHYHEKNQCWSPDVPDVDCPGSALCCFNGCVNVCMPPPPPHSITNKEDGYGQIHLESPNHNGPKQTLLHNKENPPVHTYKKPEPPPKEHPVHLYEPVEKYPGPQEHHSISYQQEAQETFPPGHHYGKGPISHETPVLQTPHHVPEHGYKVHQKAKNPEQALPNHHYDQEPKAPPKSPHHSTVYHENVSEQASQVPHYNEAPISNKIPLTSSNPSPVSYNPKARQPIKPKQVPKVQQGHHYVQKDPQLTSARRRQNVKEPIQRPSSGQRFPSEPHYNQKPQEPEEHHSTDYHQEPKPRTPPKSHYEEVPISHEIPALQTHQHISESSYKPHQNIRLPEKSPPEPHYDHKPQEPQQHQSIGYHVEPKPRTPPKSHYEQVPISHETPALQTRQHISKSSYKPHQNIRLPEKSPSEPHYNHKPQEPQVHQSIGYHQDAVQLAPPKPHHEQVPISHSTPQEDDYGQTNIDSHDHNEPEHTLIHNLENPPVLAYKNPGPPPKELPVDLYEPVKKYPGPQEHHSISYQQDAPEKVPPGHHYGNEPISHDTPVLQTPHHEPDDHHSIGYHQEASQRAFPEPHYEKVPESIETTVIQTPHHIPESGYKQHQTSKTLEQIPSESHYNQRSQEPEDHNSIGYHQEAKQLAPPEPHYDHVPISHETPALKIQHISESGKIPYQNARLPEQTPSDFHYNQQPQEDHSNGYHQEPEPQTPPKSHYEQDTIFNETPPLQTPPHILESGYKSYQNPKTPEKFPSEPQYNQRPQEPQDHHSLEYDQASPEHPFHPG